MSRALTKESLFEKLLDPNDASTPGTRKAKQILLQSVNLEKLHLIWDCLNKHIHSQLKAGKGVSIAAFGKFAPNKADGDKHTLSLCDNFIRVFNVQVIKKPTVFGTVLDVNYTLLSLETKLHKEEIRSIVSELFSLIGQAISSCKQPLMIDFAPLGTLYADHRRVQFAFGEKNGRGRDGSSNASFSNQVLDSAKSLELQGFNNTPIIEEQEEDEDNMNRVSSVPPLQLPRPSSAASSRSSTSSSYSSASTKSKVAKSILKKAMEEDDSTPIVYPVFLSRDTKSAKKKYRSAELRQEVRTRKIEHNLEKAFERIEEEISREAERLREQEEEIAKRNEMSEMAYKEKLLQAKRDQLEMNAFLVEQSKERQERERKEKEALRNGKIIDDALGGKVPFPVEQERDYAGAERGKLKLKRALQQQMREREMREREIRAQSVAEERFLADCNIKLLQADRQTQLQKKMEERKVLQSNWERQKKLAGMQKMIVEAKNGKLLSHVMSDDGLLTVRSASSSSRRAALPGSLF